MSITTLIGQWLSHTTPERLRDMAESDHSLVKELKPFEFMVKMQKSSFDLKEYDADVLLDYVFANFKPHYFVLTNYKPWYRRQIDELRAYIQSL